MLFTSGEFLFVYLPLTLLGFFLLARIVGNTFAAAWLVVASFVFYAYWLPAYTVLLALSIVFNYLLGTRLSTASNPRACKHLLICAIAVDLLVLGYFKYANFFLDTITTLTGRSLGNLNVILPIGISFFTFTQIAYIADVYAGKVKERNPLHYALFVTYFPHLIAGPVLHHAEMMPQFAQPEIYRPRLENFASGLCFLLVGLAKKVLVADSWAPTANAVFDAHHFAASAGSVWSGVLAYTLQIYFDFSGYSDMAVGLSLLIGVRLPFNFNAPYGALSIIDFWRRWHMTLSRFLRDYLYVPLGGNRHGTVRRYLNLLVTMLLGGLWHGASWTFVLWGGLHGMYLMVNHAWRNLLERLLGTAPSRLPRVARWAVSVASLALTLLCVVIAWVFFRAPDLNSAMTVLNHMFTARHGTGELVAGPPMVTIALLVVSFAIAMLGPTSQRWIDGRFAIALQRYSHGARRCLLLSALVGGEIALISILALISASRTSTEFIYFNF
jgi:alginate O-acetyltransferase complex protein AlgI